MWPVEAQLAVKALDGLGLWEQGVVFGLGLRLGFFVLCAKAAQAHAGDG